MAVTVKKYVAQRNLAILWFIVSFLIFLIVLVQGFSVYNSSQATQLWDWTLSKIIPVLTLMIGVFVAESKKIADDAVLVDRFFYRLNFFTSLFYLLLILGFIVSKIFYDDDLNKFFEMLKNANIPMSVFSGLVNLILGIFFVKQS